MKIAKSPVLVSRSLTGIANGSAPFVPEGLPNQLNQGMWVDEFRFTATTKRVDAGAWFGDVPDALRVALRIGSTELTKGLIPAALLCRPRDWQMEAPSVLTNFIWRLPKPLYLPENANVNVQVKQQEDFRAQALLMDVDVAMVGRPTLEVPKFVDVPYASFFQGSLVTAGTVVDRSNENDLRNPFRVPLRVVRFSATNWAKATVTADPTSDPTQATVGMLNGATFDAPGMCGANTIQLFDQDGDFGVRDVSPLGVIAALADRSWRVDAILKPNSFFVADLSTTLSTKYDSTRQAIGMIGYRTMPVTDLGAAR